MYGIKKINVFPENVVVEEVERRTLNRTSGECITEPTRNETTNVTCTKKNIEEPTCFWNNQELVNEISQLPRVFHYNGKTKQEIEQIVNMVEQRPTDLPLNSLLNYNLINMEKKVPEQCHRGFTILNCSEKARQIEEFTESEKDRPVYYVFSGMGIEEYRNGMCKEMMKLECFRRSIIKSHELLRGYGIDLMELINNCENVNTLTPMKSYVVLTSIQIALVDCLSSIGIKHDGLIGYSIGEFVCAYADKCLTHEQTLLCSYYVAKCIQDSHDQERLPQGLMIQVNDLTWEQLKVKCPTGVVPVCFDSVDQFLLTGPKTVVREFLRQLQLEGVNVREICQQYPESSKFSLLHSYYMTTCVPVLKKYFELLNIKPTQRTSKWISTSMTETKWQSEYSYCSTVEYFLNMLCSPVMFSHALRYIPKNSIVIEISPRSFLRNILNRVFNPSISQQNTCDVTILPLMPWFGEQTTPVTSNLVWFLNQLGRLYLEGVEFDSFKLYLPIDMQKSICPVQVDQEIITLLNEKCNIVPNKSLYVIRKPTTTLTSCTTPIETMFNSLHMNNGLQSFKYTIDCESLLNQDSYLLGHQINGRVLYPTSGYLVLVMKSLAKILNKKNPTTLGQTVSQTIDLETLYSTYLNDLIAEDLQLPCVEFENVQIYRATVLRDIFLQQSQQTLNNREQKVVFQVNIQPLNGYFELVQDENLIVSGRYSLPVESQEVCSFKKQWDSILNGTWSLPIECEEIYRQLRSIGYEFNGEFKNILRTNERGTMGEISWNGKWITCLDAMIQLNIFSQQREQQPKGLLLPTRIRSIRIDPRQHLIRMDKSGVLPYFYESQTNRIQCGAIEIMGLELIPVVLPKGQFYPTIKSTVQQQPEQQQQQQQTSFLNQIKIFDLNGLEFLERPTISQLIEGKFIPFNIQNDGYVFVEKLPTSIQVTSVEVPSSISSNVRIQSVEQTTSCQSNVRSEQPTLSSIPKYQEEKECKLEKSIERTEQPKTTVPCLSGLFNPEQTYIIVGGLDCEFGMEMAQWLSVECGVRYLVLTTVQENKTNSSVVDIKMLNESQIRRLTYLQGVYGVEFKLVSSYDLDDETECLSMIRSACKMTQHFEGETSARIGGVFHLDTVFSNQQKALEGLFNMDRYTRMEKIMPVDTGIFVVFTRYGGVSPSKQSIEFSSVVEKVCEYRARDFGKHSLVVDWNVLFSSEFFFNMTPVQVNRQSFMKLESLLCKSKQEQFEKDLFLMPKNVIERLNDVELTEQEIPLFIVHPMEGNVEMLRHFAKHIRVPVFGLQFTEEAIKCETVEKLADFYFQQIEKQYPQVNRIHLCGHSFGSTVALEMASRKSDRCVSLTLLDSCLTETFLNTISTCPTSQMKTLCESEILYKFYEQYMPPTMKLKWEQFSTIVNELPSFDERVKYVVKELMEKSELDFDLYDLDLAVRSYFIRMTMSCKYQPKDLVKLSEILYIRPIPLSSCIDFFYQSQELVDTVLRNLRQVFNGKLQVQIVDADYKTFLVAENACKIAYTLNDFLVRF